VGGFLGLAARDGILRRLIFLIEQHKLTTELKKLARDGISLPALAPFVLAATPLKEAVPTCGPTRGNRLFWPALAAS